MLYRTANPHGGVTDAEILDFSANTNPLGTPESVREAVRSCLTQLDRYPDPGCRELVQAIAAAQAVPEEWILCGNGASELIDCYCRALRPETAVELAPTFSEYSASLERCGCRVERYALRAVQGFLPGKDFPEFLKETGPQAVFLCNPNNPTGCLLPDLLLDEILEYSAEQNIRVFLDECFLDLTDGGRSRKAELSRYPNLFLLKAFTKSYGMAGLRLGYGLCSDGELLERMAQAAPMWNVSSPAQAAGIAALQEEAFLEETRSLLHREKNYLYRRLLDFGLTVCPSRANFLLFRGPETLGDALKQCGIAVRDCRNFHGLEAGWYRIAVKRHEENRRLTDAVEEILRGEC